MVAWAIDETLTYKEEREGEWEEGKKWKGMEEGKEEVTS